MLLLLYYSKELQLCNRCETFFLKLQKHRVFLYHQNLILDYLEKEDFLSSSNTLWYFLHIYLNACVSLSHTFLIYVSVGRVRFKVKQRFLMRQTYCQYYFSFPKDQLGTTGGDRNFDLP